VCLLAVGSARAGTDGTWITDDSGEFWSNNEDNWQDGIIADDVDGTAYFTTDITARRTVMLGTDRWIGHLVFSDGGGSGHDWTIQQWSNPPTRLKLITSTGAPTVRTVTRGMLDCGVTGTQGFTKSGSGTLDLLRANLYSGVTTVSAGTIKVLDDASLGTTGAGNHTVISSGATVYVRFSRALDESFILSGAGTDGYGALQLEEDVDIRGGITLDGNATIGTMESGDRRISGAISLPGSAVLTLKDTYDDTLHLDGTITGTGGLDIGTETFLTVANTFTGATVVSSILHVDHNAALQGSTVQMDTPGLYFHTSVAAPVFGGLAGSADLSAGNRQVTVGGNGQDTTYTGALKGSGCSLVKTGTGTLTLTGASTYGGGTTLGQGVLSAAAEANLGDTAGGLTFDGGVLRITGSGFGSTVRSLTFAAGGGGFDIAEASHTFVVNQSLTGSGDLAKTGPGTMTLTGNNGGYTGDITVGGGVLSAGVGDSLGASTRVTVASGATLRIEDDGEYFGSLAGAGTVEIAGRVMGVGSDGTGSEFSGSLTDDGSFKKTGSGTMTLSGDSSSYTGDVTVRAGVLVAAHGSALGTGTVMLDGGTLRVAGGVTVDNAIGFAGGGGTLGGTGTLRTDVTLGAGDAVAPGASAGLLTVDGNYTQGADGLLEIELGGLLRGDQYDALVVTGQAALAGTLTVTLIDDFSPANGNVFDILDWGTLAGGSAFDTVNLPDLPGGLTWDDSTLYTTGELTVVPEPASLMLLLGGALGLRPRRRTRVDD